MLNSIFVKNYTGAVALSHTLAPGQSFKLKEVRIHLGAAGGAANFTATVDANAGSAYDLVVITKDMTSVTDYIWTPEKDMFFESGDEIDFAWANGSTRTYGLTVIIDLL